MARKSLALAATLALSSALFTAAQATAASHSHARADKPPFPYADCIKEVKKQHKASNARAKHLCDQLVEKGWIKPPNA
ncbi:hypothetical protein [Streptomyces spirodelae]|uniref:Uncharacterized protein n=1 Tax=Streptomyces spirodelae TaxID=2812904 RepID=A0ABS3WT75_9ACTN|nr:hypothetical protein [Streptomyces spirodelae]MBO8186327.1 hypothetical protein [Streptomyces spirodelae]